MTEATEQPAQAAKKKCFAISPIGNPGSIRDEADWVLKGFIEPALQDHFTVERADAYPKNNVIANQVILAINSAVNRPGFVGGSNS
jgi:hypothetical protein